MNVKPSQRQLVIRRLALTFILASCVASGATAAADDAFICMEESQEICDQKNRNMAMFIKGRDAFDRGREIGDFTEARGYALALIEDNDPRHGLALMKFIYVQLGLGVHKNLVEAYRWVSADIAAGTQYRRLDLDRIRNQLERLMTPAQLEEAKNP